MTRIRVLIADDHALVRSGFRALLNPQPDLEVVGEAANGQAAVEACRCLAPDVVLLDLTMPGRSGVSTLQELRQACPTVRVLVVTMHEDEAYARQALLAGAAGYMLKRSLATELITAIRTVHQGRLHLSPSIAGAIGGAPAPRTSLLVPDRPLEQLTGMEREVVRLIAMGQTNNDIATQLRVPEPAVELCRSAIMTRLNLHTRADLVRLALGHGLLGRA